MGTGRAVYPPTVQPQKKKSSVKIPYTGHDRRPPAGQLQKKKKEEQWKDPPTYGGTAGDPLPVSCIHKKKEVKMP
jgi:hypothetical protein